MPSGRSGAVEAARCRKSGLIAPVKTDGSCEKTEAGNFEKEKNKNPASTPISVDTGFSYLLDFGGAAFWGAASLFSGEPFDQPVGNISPKIGEQVEQDGHEEPPF